VLAINRFNGKDNASGGDGSLLRVVRRRWLNHMRRRMAYHAVGVGQPIRMKVRLLDGGAEEEKDGAQDGEHEAFARFRGRFLTYS
jgi:hypothetical protein